MTAPHDPEDPGGHMAPADPQDPVLERRSKMARIAQSGQRLGYVLYLVAMVLFALELIDGFGGGLTTAIVVCLVAGSAVLAPTIILGYAVKAADREDRGLPHGH